MSPPKKILVRTPNWIGDHVMAMPFYHGLRKQYADAEITFLCAESIAGLSGLNTQRLCDREWVLSERERYLGSAFWSRAMGFRKESFDLAIALPASFSAALMLVLSGARHRIGFFADVNTLFLSGGLPWRGRLSGKHKSLLYLELLEFVVGNGPALTPEIPSLPQPRNLEHRKKQVVIAPGASIPLREWPYYEELIQLISKQFPQYTLAVVGSHRETAWTARLKALGLPRVLDWVGKTSLVELITLCSESSLVIANDSGVAHVSATLAGAPTLVLFGPGDPQYISPLGPHVSGIRLENLPCSPCEKPTCRAPYGYKTCLNQLGVEAVLAKVNEILAAKALPL